MTDQTVTLIDAIASGDTISSAQLFNDALLSKVSDLIDSRRQEVAQSMFESSKLDESVLVGTWHSGSYHKSKDDTDNGDGTHSRVMQQSDIGTHNGYTAEEQKAVKKLKAGDVWHSEDTAHTITKVDHKAVN